MAAEALVATWPPRPWLQASMSGPRARRLIKTHAEMEEAVARCKDKAFVSKPSQDFLRRVVQTSGVSDATAQPEGARPLRRRLECERLAPAGVPVARMVSVGVLQESWHLCMILWSVLQPHTHAHLRTKLRLAFACHTQGHGLPI
jgi:hypothetical protein